MMVVYIQVLGRLRNVGQSLRRDGWTVDEESPNTLEATHPGVDGQPAARARLSSLGLLTSGRLRIEFAPTGL
jgi:hypothetical protein